MLTRPHHVQVACPAGSEDDRLAASCEDAGHPVEWDPHFPGHRRLYVLDPVGNRLEVLQPLDEG